MNQASISYKHHCSPSQVIARAVWLYYRFSLSLRLVEEMLFERGIVVSYETIRRWGLLKFGSDYACRLRVKQPSSNDIWHLDEVVIGIGDKKHWLRRTVDQDGTILNEIMHCRCCYFTALPLMIVFGALIVQRESLRVIMKSQTWRMQHEVAYDYKSKRFCVIRSRHGLYVCRQVFIFFQRTRMEVW